MEKLDKSMKESVLESTYLVKVYICFMVHGQNMPKKGRQEKILFFTFNNGQLPIF